MKKIIAGFILGVSLIINPSVFAIEEMTDAVLKKTTGQAGLSVRVDNMVMEDVRLSLLYIDDDGTAATHTGTHTGTQADGASLRLKTTINSVTFRAIFDGTDRGGYLKREYGTLMRREVANGGEPHWAGLSIGGDISWTELKISTSKKLKLHSYMKAFNNRAAGLAEVKEAYDQISSLKLIFSEANSAENINAVMAATGMGESAASSVYLAANNYAKVLDDKSLADEIGTRAAYANTSVSGVAITVPTLETREDFSTRSLEVETDGFSDNDGAEYMKISYVDTVSTTLSGHVEVCVIP